MNPNYYVAKAIHALNTGQPNLAMLYMQRGMVELERRRREHLKGSIAGQFVLLGEAVNEMTEMFVRAFAPAITAATKAMNEFHADLLKSYDQEFFALVNE